MAPWEEGDRQAARVCRSISGKRANHSIRRSYFLDVSRERLGLTERQLNRPASAGLNEYVSANAGTRGDNSMKVAIRHSKRVVFQVACTVLLASLSQASMSGQQFTAGKKAKVTGTIVSRSGDLIKITVKKKGNPAVVTLTDDTKFDRERAFRLRPASMDASAMLPGLTITVDGVGNAQGYLDAKTIKFDPNVFDIEMAEEQQIRANKSAAGEAQTTADQGVTAAGAAQSSANQAQSSANQAQGTADAAGQVATAAAAGTVINASEVAQVNQRVSDLGEYTTVGEAAVFFDTGQSVLSADDKAALSKLASDAMATQNYMIEITGYASSTGTKSVNQQLSDARAAAVADYLRNQANVPMRRVLAPAGYGATHAAATNTDAQGRDINQRVDVKVIVNKGLSQNI
jgi:outer membrane protein OmpA-like peptidoglycan-associated protein